MFKKLVLSTSLFLLSLIGLAGVASAESLTPTVYTTPSSAAVLSIAAGPDGNMWFTMPEVAKIGKSTLDGSITEYPIPSGHNPAFIAAGPDGNMWFTEQQNKSVGKITPAGQITEYDLSSTLTETSEAPIGIAAGPDGNMWVATGLLGTNNQNQPNGEILKITTAGLVTPYQLDLPGVAGAVSIAAGPDGNMWFTRGGTNNSTNYISKITMSGTITSYPLPGLGSGSANITTGPDGNMWYIRIIADGQNPPHNQVGKITMSGDPTEYNLPDGSFAYYGLALGPDGRVWYTDTAAKKLGAISANGDLTEYDLPSDFAPLGLTVGPDNNLWITSQTGIARIGDTPQGNNPSPSAPEEGSNPTPGAPRTGKLIGAAIASSALLGMVLVVASEVKKAHHIEKTSSR